jgi:hypothetical protein
VCIDLKHMCTKNISNIFGARLLLSLSPLSQDGHQAFFMTLASSSFREDLFS